MIRKKINLLFCFILTSFASQSQNGWVHYSQSNSSLPENSVRSIAFGLDSSIWIGTDYGLAKLWVGNFIQTINQNHATAVAEFGIEPIFGCLLAKGAELVQRSVS